MVLFFSNGETVYAVETVRDFDGEDIRKLEWLFGGGRQVASERVDGIFIGPRREMITPWSTNAVDISRNMGIEGILRIEEFARVESETAPYDRMLKRMYRDGLDQSVFRVDRKPEPIVYIDDLRTYNREEGLALSEEEIVYLEEVSRKMGRKLTDS